MQFCKSCTNLCDKRISRVLRANKPSPFYSNSLSLLLSLATFSPFIFLFYFSFFRLAFNRPDPPRPRTSHVKSPADDSAQTHGSYFSRSKTRRPERLIERRHAQLDPRESPSINKSHTAVAGDCFVVNFAPLVNATRILDILPLLIQKD